MKKFSLILLILTSISFMEISNSQASEELNFTKEEWLSIVSETEYNNGDDLETVLHQVDHHEKKCKEEEKYINRVIICQEITHLEEDIKSLKEKIKNQTAQLLIAFEKSTEALEVYSQNKEKNQNLWEELNKIQEMTQITQKNLDERNNNYKELETKEKKFTEMKKELGSVNKI